MITLKTPKEIDVMAEGGRRLAKILEILKTEVRPGVETKIFDLRARELMREAEVKPAFLNYKPAGALKAFKAALCVSVNDEVVHGLPSNYVLREGDLVKLDIGLIYKGWYSDMAVTMPVGKISKKEELLIQATEEALYAGISAAKLGNTLGDIGAAIEKKVSQNGFSIVEELTGHGIGKELHEDPYVFNTGREGEDILLREGMVLALEPMVAMKKGNVIQRDDDSFATRDGSRSAHFEHTIAITKNGPRILTKM